MAKTNPSLYREVVAAIDSGRCSPLPEPNITESGCWVWRDSAADKYASVGRHVGGKTRLCGLHMLSLVYHDRDALATMHEGSFACHKPVCGGNRACYNPAHLYLGDAATNAQDRRKHSPRNPVARELADDVVRAIRAVPGAPGAQGICERIAAKYGITWYQVKHIRNGRTYAHVPDLASFADAMDAFIARAYGQPTEPAIQHGQLALIA